MKNLNIITTLKASLLAGLLAGLLVAAFHFIVTEPLIEKAINLEEQISHSDEEEDPIISRDTQRVGLFLGYVLYGLSWASLFAVIYYLIQNFLPGSGASQRGLALASLVYWCITFLPFIKYPANPPGVGDPATIDYRQTIYLSLLGISLLGGIIALLIHNRPGKQQSGIKSWLPSLAFLAVFSIILYFVMPANPDPVTMPLDLIGTFRVLSLSGLTIFWAAFGLLFAWLASRFVKNTGQTLKKA